MYKFLSKPTVHRIFMILFAVSGFFTLSALITGCSGSVVGDADNVLTVISLAVSTLSGVFAFIPGAAAFAPALNAIGTTLTSLEEAFAEYKTNATETTYQKIQEFVALLQANLQKLVNPEGVSSAVVNKVNQIVSAVMAQVTAWLTLIQQLQAPAAGSAEELSAHTVAPVTISTVKPMSSKSLHAQLKTIVEEASGDATTDWAFKTASRF
jgi:hypothetical protein